jgi:hypothetical protein
MEVAWKPGSEGRGSALLLEHCAALEAEDDMRSPAYSRLEDAIGSPLARLLVEALAGTQARPRGFAG